MMPASPGPRRGVGDAGERHSVSEGFIELGDGRCWYRFDGPQDGPLLLLIHGATIPAWQFDRIVPYLNEAGFRTLRADMFGHGYSARPRLRYDIQLFVRQFSELLDRLDIERRVDVLAHSLGSAVTAWLVSARPERFGSVALVAPMLDFAASTPVLRLLKAPLLGEVLMPSVVKPMLIRRRTRRYRHIEDGRFAALFREQLAEPGFGRALLSMFRSGALGNQSEGYRQLGAQQHRVMVLHGVDDVIVRTADIARIMHLMPGAILNELPGTHALLLANPDTVTPIVSGFFNAPAGLARAEAGEQSR